MKPIGAFISLKALKEYGNRLLEEYGIEYAHTHLLFSQRRLEGFTVV